MFHCVRIISTDPPLTHAPTHSPTQARKYLSLGQPDVQQVLSFFVSALAAFEPDYPVPPGVFGGRIPNKGSGTTRRGRKIMASI